MVKTERACGGMCWVGGDLPTPPLNFCFVLYFLYLLNVVPTIENAVSAGSENNNEIKKYFTVGKLQRIV